MKCELRKKLIALRNTLPPASLTYDMLTGYKQFRDAKTVFCYVSAFGEVDTRSLLFKIAEEKTLTVPYCTDNNGTMIAVKISTPESLKRGRFNILEPVCPIPFPKESIDFAIVPGVAFARDMYRLGYGKGYYDRFLSDISPFKIGVCKKELFLEKLPHNRYDIKMDSIITL